MEDRNSILLSKYANMLDRDPSSRVFAPLAEVYRKIGMHEKAFDILKKGLRKHPDYQLATIILGSCYFDIGELETAYRVLEKIAEKSYDNIKYQSLFAKVCLKLGYKTEALEAYKKSLYLNPHDEEAINKVSELEEDTKVRPYMGLEFLDDAVEGEEKLDDLDQWNSLEFNESEELVEESDKETLVLESVPEAKSEESEEDFSGWDMEDLTDKKETTFDNFVLEAKEDDAKEILAGPEPEPEPEPEFERVAEIQASSIVEEKAEEFEEDLETHTLVDIYIAQKHYDKAIEILEKIIEKNPNDERSIKKLGVLKEKTDSPKEDLEYENNLKKYERIEKTYMKFLEGIIKRSKDFALV